MISRRKALGLASTGIFAFALVGMTQGLGTVAHAQGNSGGRGGGGSGNGNGGGRGGDNAGGGSGGRGNGGGGSGRGGGSRGHGKDQGGKRDTSRGGGARGRSSAPDSTGTVVHENGMSETLRNGRYIMRDAQGRTIVDRPAALLDHLRMRSRP